MVLIATLGEINMRASKEDPAVLVYEVEAHGSGRDGNLFITLNGERAFEVDVRVVGVKGESPFFSMNIASDTKDIEATVVKKLIDRASQALIKAVPDPRRVSYRTATGEPIEDWDDYVRAKKEEAEVHAQKERAKRRGNDGEPVRGRFNTSGAESGRTSSAHPNESGKPN